jgi:hypothetical protein
VGRRRLSWCRKSLGGVAMVMINFHMELCVESYALDIGTGILCKSLGFGVFAKIYTKNIMIPSREIPFFGKAPKRFWAIIAKFRCIRVSSDDPKNQITKYSVIWVTRITKIWQFGFFLVSFG